MSKSHSAIAGERTQENDSNSTYCEECGCRITVGQCKHGVKPPGILLVIDKNSDFRHKGKAGERTHDYRAGVRKILQSTMVDLTTNRGGNAGRLDEVIDNLRNILEETEWFNAQCKII